jgi:hypothetical protein
MVGGGRRTRTCEVIRPLICSGPRWPVVRHVRGSGNRWRYHSTALAQANCNYCLLALASLLLSLFVMFFGIPARFATSRHFRRNSAVEKGHMLMVFRMIGPERGRCERVNLAIGVWDKSANSSKTIRFSRRSNSFCRVVLLTAGRKRKLSSKSDHRRPEIHFSTPRSVSLCTSDGDVLLTTTHSPMTAF